MDTARYGGHPFVSLRMTAEREQDDKAGWAHVRFFLPPE